MSCIDIHKQGNALTYIPKKNCLAEKVLSYFVQNPDEELSSFDIAAKFGVTPPNDVSEKMVPLVQMGLLSALKRGKFRHYIAGDQLDAWSAKNATSMLSHQGCEVQHES